MADMSIREAVMKQRECDQRVIQEQIEAEGRSQSTMLDLAPIRARLAQAKRQIAAFSGQRIDPPFWLVEYESHVAALLAALDDATKILREAQACITNHHDINLKRDWGALCSVCVPNEGVGIHERIDGLLAALDAQAQKEAKNDL